MHSRNSRKSLLLATFIFSICQVGAVRLEVSSSASAAVCPSVWPQPVDTSCGSETANLDPATFKFTIVGKSSPILEDAIERYHDIVFIGVPSKGKRHRTAHDGPNNDVKVIQVNVLSDDESLQLGVDESYSLELKGPSGLIEAKTVFGALRALETVAQLVTVEEKTFFIQGLPIVIHDAPVYSHRGLLIDTARHYLPLALVKKAIDGMIMSKMNTLHWHIVDAQSFPLVSTSYPRLSQGRWADGATYTLDEINAVVQYGLFRGVRVVMEIDVPGHAYSWGIGYPNVTVDCPRYAANVNNIPLDPLPAFTYSVVEGVLTDLAQVTVDDFVHLGGDEVVYGCWNQSDAIRQWMQTHHTTDFNDVMQYFQDNLHNLTAVRKKQVLHWQEVFNNGIKVPKDTTIIHVWKDAGTLEKVVDAGYRGIMSYGWYLSQVAIDWKSMYTNTMPSSDLIVGGEACMWGEYCDETNLEERVWPRAAAVAERLWSKGPFDVDEALPRLITHRCQMVRRGFNASPLEPGYCPWAL